MTAGLRTLARTLQTYDEGGVILSGDLEQFIKDFPPGVAMSIACCEDFGCHGYGVAIVNTAPSRWPVPGGYGNPEV